MTSLDPPLLVARVGWVGWCTSAQTLMSAVGERLQYCTGRKGVGLYFSSLRRVRAELLSVQSYSLNLRTLSDLHSESHQHGILQVPQNINIRKISEIKSPTCLKFHNIVSYELIVSLRTLDFVNSRSGDQRTTFLGPIVNSICGGEGLWKAILHSAFLYVITHLCSRGCVFNVKLVAVDMFCWLFGTTTKYQIMKPARKRPLITSLHREKAYSSRGSSAKQIVLSGAQQNG